MTQVFISYSRRDIGIATKLHSAISGAGIESFIDVAGVTPADQWETQVFEALDASDFLLLVLSPSSLESSYAKFQWEYFLRHDKPIIIVLISPVEQLPFRLQSYQIVDLTDINQFDLAVAQVLQIFEADVPVHAPIEQRQEQRVFVEDLYKNEQQFYRGTIIQPEVEVSVLLGEGHKHRENNRVNEAIAAYTQVLLDRGEAAYRVDAIRALAELGAASSDVMQSLIEDPEVLVRREAVRALVNFQSPQAYNVLDVAAVADDDLEVRLYAGLLNLYFKQPNILSLWLNSLSRSDNPRLRTLLSEAQLFANELLDSAGHVFISYSRSDAEPFTLELVDTLRNEYKFGVWMDTNLTPGTDDWRRAIATAIEQCSFLLLILSPEVHNSRWIGEEVSYAEQLGKDRIYVKYKETHIPFGMTGLQSLRNVLLFEDYPEEMLSELVEEFERRSVPRTE